MTRAGVDNVCFNGHYGVFTTVNNVGVSVVVDLWSAIGEFALVHKRRFRQDHDANIRISMRLADLYEGRDLALHVDGVNSQNTIIVDGDWLRTLVKRQFADGRLCFSREYGL